VTGVQPMQMTLTDFVWSLLRLYSLRPAYPVPVPKAFIFNVHYGC